MAGNVRGLLAFAKDHPDAACPAYGDEGLLKGAWDVVTRVVMKVAMVMPILITSMRVLIYNLTRSHDSASTQRISRLTKQVLSRVIGREADPS